MTNSNKEYRLDGKIFQSKEALYQYIEVTYEADLERLNWSAARYYFFRKYKKTEGRCVISGKPTKFNDQLGRYERFYSEVEANIYREQFKARMEAKFGKVHLLDDPERQKLMLNNRSITTEYIWEDKTRTPVTGTYEYDFLNYCEHTLALQPSTFTTPPTIYYKDGNINRFYLPDFFIPSLNLIVEIKGSNNHYQKRDQYKENLKEQAVKEAGFKFLQVNDKNYTEFNIYFKKVSSDI